MSEFQSVNLRQLSEHLGLSQTTVSRALNGFPEVGAKTRIRVEQAARDLNYRPNPSAAGLATGKSRGIGHVVPVSEHQMINPHFSDFLSGASEVYADSGYDLLLRTAQGDEEERIYREFASRRRVDGVVVHGPHMVEPRIGLLKELGLPFVVHGRDGDDVHDYPWLDVNNQRAFKHLTQYLVDEGHQRIALVNGLESMSFAARRRRGYEEALNVAGIAADEALILTADMTEPYGYAATNQLLAKSDPPTAIVYSSILPAMGGMRALQSKNIQPGADVGLATFDDCLSFLQAEPGSNEQFCFTAMRSSIYEAGRRVAELLLEQIRDPATDNAQELWEAELVKGQTT